VCDPQHFPSDVATQPSSRGGTPVGPHARGTCCMVSRALHIRCCAVPIWWVAGSITALWRWVGVEGLPCGSGWYLVHVAGVSQHQPEPLGSPTTLPHSYSTETSPCQSVDALSSAPEFRVDCFRGGGQGAGAAWRPRWSLLSVAASVCKDQPEPSERHLHPTPTPQCRSSVLAMSSTSWIGDG
jgi:hypothetical protein